jgi:tetratricopeptide (TPR) repeat protein
VVSKALAKDPGDRYPTMGDLRDSLLDVLHEVAPGRATRIDALFRTGARRVRGNARYAAWGALLVALIAVALNWQRVRCAIGWCGLGDTKGIVVMPLNAGATAGPDALFTAGLIVDLSRRVQRLAAFDTGLWVVPAFRARDVREPAKAKASLGVDAVITSRITAHQGNHDLRLQVLDAGTLVPLETADVHAAPDQAWHSDLDARLADLLEVDVDAPDLTAIGSCYSMNVPAFEAFVIGLGHLTPGDRTTVDAADSAVAAFDRALGLDSTFVEAHVRRAEAFFRKATSSRENVWLDEAIRSCNRALRLDARNAAAYEWLGRSQSARGENESATEAFKKSLALNPRDPVVLNRLAWTNVVLGAYDEAEAIDRSAIEANPRYFSGYMDLGYLYYVLERYDEAIVQFETVRSMAPDHAPVYNYLGALFFLRDRWDEAIASFEKSFELGKNYEACTNLGTLYYMEERFADAARMYEWAREYYPQDHIVVGNIAAALYWIPDERERARSLFKEAAEILKQDDKYPGDPLTLAFLAGYFSIASPDSAVGYAERAVAAAPNNAEVLFRVAGVYEQTGERAKALVFLGQAIEHGYSRKIIEHERVFQDLRGDARYKLLASANTESENADAGR